MDSMFDTYGELFDPVLELVKRRAPRSSGVSPIAHRQAAKAAALDALRGLLPAGSLSNVGIYGSGQAYEQLILRMRAHPLGEARRFAELMLAELRKVIPSFLTRLERQERGGAWVDYLTSTRERTERLVSSLIGEGEPSPGPSVKLTGFDTDGEDRVLGAICFEHSDNSSSDIERRLSELTSDERRRLVKAYTGKRENRRHRPGRALEATSYRFEVVCDYGAFRDLQRHRLLTIEWQPLSTALGYEVPPLVEEAGLADRYVESLERSRSLHEALKPVFPEESAYAVALAYNVRFQIEMNAREAMHLIELRSSPQGHPAYRRIAAEMHRLIAEEAGHRLIAGAMSFLDREAAELGRLGAEQRAVARSKSPAAKATASAGSRRPRRSSPRKGGAGSAP
jgi:thymidylate synthase ThyX